MQILWVALFLSIAFPLQAIELPGASDQLEQGGLYLGRTAPANQVLYNGRQVRVGTDGIFVLGFGRDAELQQTYTIVDQAGKRTDYQLSLDSRQYRIQKINGVAKRFVSPSPKQLERIKSDNQKVQRARQRDDARQDFMSGFSWPVSGRITGVYGSQRVFNGEPRRPHYGVDIAAPVGTPVRAPAAGVVTLAEPDMYFSGGTLILDHGHGLSSSFLHLSKLHVQPGDRVKQGQVIAEVGATGRVTGAHLDWRINWFEQRLDPQLLLPPQPQG